MVLKKYANRRLYDTGSSRYITLDEVTERIRAGEDVIVLDATTGADLTQATLTQLILDNRGAAKLLPVPLLTQLVRLGDDGLAEFFSRWVQWALEAYVQGRQSVSWLQHLNPLLQAGSAVMPNLGGGQPFGQWPGQGWNLNTLASLFEHGRQAGQQGRPPNPAEAASQPPPPASPAQADEMTRLRKQIDELRAGIQGRKRGPKRKTKAVDPKA